MAQGKDSRQSLELAQALEGLASSAGAANAAVLDCYDALWASARPLASTEEQLPVQLVARALESAGKPLNRGGRVRLCESDEAPFFLAWSFAGIYLLVVWFDAPFNAFVVQGRVRKALPAIEGLTIAIPPPDGPVDSPSRSSRMKKPD